MHFTVSSQFLRFRFNYGFSYFLRYSGNSTSTSFHGSAGICPGVWSFFVVIRQIRNISVGVCCAYTLHTWIACLIILSTVVTTWVCLHIKFLYVLVVVYLALSNDWTNIFQLFFQVYKHFSYINPSLFR